MPGSRRSLRRSFGLPGTTCRSPTVGSSRRPGERLDRRPWRPAATGAQRATGRHCRPARHRRPDHTQPDPTTGDAHAPDRDHRRWRSGTAWAMPDGADAADARPVPGTRPGRHACQPRSPMRHDPQVILAILLAAVFVAPVAAAGPAAPPRRPSPASSRRCTWTSSPPAASAEDYDAPYLPRRDPARVRRRRARGLRRRDGHRHRDARPAGRCASRAPTPRELPGHPHAKAGTTETVQAETGAGRRPLPPVDDHQPGDGHRRQPRRQELRRRPHQLHQPGHPAVDEGDRSRTPSPAARRASRPSSRRSRRAG